MLYSRTLTSTHPRLLPRLDVQTGKRKFTDPLSVDPKRKKIVNIFFLQKKKPLGSGVLWERYLPIHGLFQILYQSRANYSRRYCYFFNSISTFVGNLMPNSSLENRVGQTTDRCTVLSGSWEPVKHFKK